MQGRRDDALGIVFLDNVAENGDLAGKNISIAEYEKISKATKAEKPKTEKPKATKADESKEDGDE